LRSEAGGEQELTRREPLMLAFGKAKSVVGLDLGSSAVKAVELKAVGSGYRVRAYATEPIPADSIVDGAILDAAAVTAAIAACSRRPGSGRGAWRRQSRATRSSSRRSACLS
jgi:hypothetical protein